MKKGTIILKWVIGLLVFFAATFLILKKIRSQSVSKSAKSIGLNQKQTEILTAVSKHETANYSSRLYKENNNAFGMKQPSKRATSSIGEKNGYASYKDIADSVGDFILWWDYNYRNEALPEDAETFVSKMKKAGYFEDTYENYLRGVKSWL